MSLTLLMLLGQLFKELHSLLVESGAPPTIVIDFILQVIPFSLTFTVPWGFLTAVLLVYGRLAADNELTSMRMAGLSLWRLSMPAIGMGVVLSALCYYINIEVAPRGKQAMSELVLTAAMDNPRNLINASQNSTKLDGIQLITDGRAGDRLTGVHIYPLPKPAKKNAKGDKNKPSTDKKGPMGNMEGFAEMHAESALVGDFDRATRELTLTLYNVTIEQEQENGRYINRPSLAEMPLKVHIPIRTQRKMKPNRFTNEEIAEVLEHWEAVRPIDPKVMERYKNAGTKLHMFPCASNLWDAAYTDTKFYHSSMKTKEERAFRTEGVQRASFACACIVFSLIGVPLAITARRRDTSTGFAIGILVAAVYFVALVFCETTRKSGGITPYIVLWVPNILGIAFAIWQHAKAKYRG